MSTDEKQSNGKLIPVTYFWIIDHDKVELTPVVQDSQIFRK